MLGRRLGLILVSLAIAGALAACSSANTSALAVPQWDYQTAAAAAQ